MKGFPLLGYCIPETAANVRISKSVTAPNGSLFQQDRTELQYKQCMANISAATI